MREFTAKRLLNHIPGGIFGFQVINMSSIYKLNKMRDSQHTW